MLWFCAPHYKQFARHFFSKHGGCIMLVLSRKIGEKVMIGDNIDIIITGVKGERVRIGIEAPPDVRVVRGELAQAPAPPPSPPRAKVYRILIAEDDQIDRELIRRCLPSSERLALFESSFGEEGLDRCRKEKPDCVILDFRLPDIDGLEFLQRMNRAERAGIPV